MSKDNALKGKTTLRHTINLTCTHNIGLKNIIHCYELRQPAAVFYCGLEP